MWPDAMLRFNAVLKPAHRGLDEMLQEDASTLRSVSRSRSDPENLGNAAKHPSSAAPCDARTIPAIFNLSNAMLGAGLLAFPSAFSRCGLIPGLLLLAAVASVSLGSAFVLLRAVQAADRYSYPALAELVIARNYACYAGGRRRPRCTLVTACALTLFYGTCVAYLIIIGNALAKLASAPRAPGAAGVVETALIGSEPTTVEALLRERSTLLALFTAVVMLPLSLLRDVSSLRIASSLGVGCAVYLMLLVVTRFAPPLDESLQAEYVRTISADTLTAVPIMTFAFGIHSVLLPTVAPLLKGGGRRSVQTVESVVLTVFGLAAVVYGCVGVAGYSSFGAAVKPNIMDNFPLATDTVLGQLALALSLTFGFPMQVVCCRQYVLALLLPPARADAPLPRTAVTVAIVGSALLLAIVVPGIDTIFGLLGATTAVYLNYLAPALFYRATVGRHHGWLDGPNWRASALVAFGALILVLSLPMELMNLQRLLTAPRMRVTTTPQFETVITSEEVYEMAVRPELPASFDHNALFWAPRDDLRVGDALAELTLGKSAHGSTAAHGSAAAASGSTAAGGAVRRSTIVGEAAVASRAARIAQQRERESKLHGRMSTRLRFLSKAKRQT